MKLIDDLIEEEREKIVRERAIYKIRNPNSAFDFFDCLSVFFLLAGFVCLFLIFFTEATLLDATCLFVISYVLSPSDGDRYEVMLKGLSMDVANIRAYLSAMTTLKKPSE